jgi:hypothetical protein
MPRRIEAEGWTWTPARPQASWRGQAIGGLVLAIACLAIGIVIGRLSLPTQQALMETAERNLPSAQVAMRPPSPQPAADGLPQGASSPGPQRPTIQEPSSSLALGSEPEEKHGGIEDPPAAKETPILLNPGTAGSPRPVEKAKRPSYWKRALAERAGKTRSAVGRASRGSSRDYQTLRDYVLSR